MSHHFNLLPSTEIQKSWLFMYSLWTKKPKFNDISVVFKYTNLYSRMQEMHIKRPWIPQQARAFSPRKAHLRCALSILHLLLRFCCLLKFYFKPLWKQSFLPFFHVQLHGKWSMPFPNEQHLTSKQFEPRSHYNNQVGVDLRGTV